MTSSSQWYTQKDTLWRHFAEHPYYVNIAKLVVIRKYENCMDQIIIVPIEKRRIICMHNGCEFWTIPICLHGSKEAEEGISSQLTMAQRNNLQRKPH